MQPISRRIAATALAGTSAALLQTLPALAQTTSAPSNNGGFTDLVPVVIWTTIVALLALAVCTIGYMYRKDRGMVTPLPDPDMVADDHGDPHRDAAGNPVPQHAISGHARGLHADSTEQAERLVQRDEPSKAH